MTNPIAEITQWKAELDGLRELLGARNSGAALTKLQQLVERKEKLELFASDITSATQTDNWANALKAIKARFDSVSETDSHPWPIPNEFSLTPHHWLDERTVSQLRTELKEHDRLIKVVRSNCQTEEQWSGWCEVISSIRCDQGTSFKGFTAELHSLISTASGMPAPAPQEPTVEEERVSLLDVLNDHYDQHSVVLLTDLNGEEAAQNLSVSLDAWSAMDGSFALDSSYQTSKLTTELLREVFISQLGPADGSYAFICLEGRYAERNKVGNFIWKPEVFEKHLMELLEAGVALAT